MSLDSLLARNVVPDPLVRMGIRRILAQRLEELSRGGAVAAHERQMRFVESLRSSPIAIHTRDANEQHYEVPTDFFRHVLGPRMKYSCAYWPDDVTTLDQAEERMLALTAERARLADGQRVLELGCGWGALTLWMAEHYPDSVVTAVSNARTQREHIESEVKARGLGNVRVVTGDMNDFEAAGRFDRVVSVEMFEHMRNYEELLRRISGWMEPDALLFVHVFCHREHAYPYEDRGPSDWMARTFFTGGLMPSDRLLLYFQEHVRAVEHWRMSGRHYALTARAWLERMDRHERLIRPLLAATYGPHNETRWWVYWRVFFMACEELWGYHGGNEWLVSHYLFDKRGRLPSGSRSSP